MAFINLLQAVYPVGAVYVSTVNTSPSSLIGGTWTQITNAALRASTSIGYTGSDTHTITINEIPSHRHDINDYITDNGTPNMQWNLLWGNHGNKNGGIYTNYVGGGKQCRLSSVLTTALSGTEPRRFFGGDVNGIY